MRRETGSSRFKARAFGVGTVALGACIVGVIVSKGAAFVRCQRFQAEFETRAASILGGSGPEVAAIASARTALRELTTDLGIEPETVRVLIERRWVAPRTEAFTHHIGFEVHSEHCEAEYERPLARQLSADELRARCAERSRTLAGLPGVAGSL